MEEWWSSASEFVLRHISRYNALLEDIPMKQIALISAGAVIVPAIIVSAIRTTYKVHELLLLLLLLLLYIVVAINLS